MTERFEPRLARVAAMIADPARSRMLAYLLDGHLASAGELAAAGGVAASTASGHLAKLEAAGLIGAEARGRHRYFRLADAEVAHALEALALVAERGSHDKRWASPSRAPLRAARCCYGHIAGRLGVALCEGLLRERYLVAGEDGELRLTSAGRDWLQQIGMDEPRPRPPRRLAYGCLDWSERRDHLAGALPAALLEHLIGRGWVATADGGAAVRNRALRLTPPGQLGLARLLGAESAAITS